MRNPAATVLAALVAVGVVLATDALHHMAIRSQNLALTHFELLSEDMATKTRLVLAEKGQANADFILQAGSSTTQTPSKAELSYTWEISPDNTTLENLRAISETILERLHKLADDQESVLRYYFPDISIKVEASVKEAKPGEKPSIRVSLRCHD